MSGRTTIYSVYGQIEGVVADAMVTEGTCRSIEFDMMPNSQKFNEQGERAHCALIMTPDNYNEYMERVRALRA